VRTHLAMQVLLGLALEGGTRRDILRECGRLLTRRGRHKDSHEELTPVGTDWVSAIPAFATAVILTANPRAAPRLATKGWGAHLLTPAAMGTIRDRIPGPEQ